jgi:hypothetical protein
MSQFCFPAVSKSLFARLFSSRTEDDRVHFMVCRESQNSPSDALPMAITSLALLLCSRAGSYMSCVSLVDHIRSDADHAWSSFRSARAS